MKESVRRGLLRLIQMQLLVFIGFELVAFLLIWAGIIPVAFAIQGVVSIGAVYVMIAALTIVLVSIFWVVLLAELDIIEINEKKLRKW